MPTVRCLISLSVRTMFQRLCFVDLETTGSNPLTDAITEVAIVSVDAHGAVEEWSTLVNPQQPIPPFVQQLTHITPDMVATAPLFADVAEAIYERLHGHCFIAHNARFDYGFLRAAFRAQGMQLKATVVCTVRLSRALDPREPRHNLDALIARHGLPAGARHRALADARVVWELWQHLQRTIEPARLQQALDELTHRPHLPPQLDADVLDELPTGSGVYLCFGADDAPLYIGGSLHVRHRVLSHFGAARPSPLDQELATRVRRLEWRQTAGETGAQLLEHALVRQLRPTLNPRHARPADLCGWWWQPDAPAVRLVRAGDPEFDRMEAVYGLFRCGKDAQKVLRRLAERHGLCLRQLGLEKGRPGQPCTGRLARRCHGACVGRETPETHHARLGAVLAEIGLANWPWPGRIGLREQDARTHQTDIHWVERWRYLGSTLDGLPCAVDDDAPFDLDIWRILTRALKRWPAADIVQAG